jgi:hypothetical protein
VAACDGMDGDLLENHHKSVKYKQDIELEQAYSCGMYDYIMDE